MPICAIYELSIACHHKVSKCKYYQVYEQLKQFETENAKLKEELNRYKEMEAKGLQEFKDIGGCWGCGIQLLLNQERVNFKKCDLENKKLKEKLEKIKGIVTKYSQHEGYLLDGLFTDLVDELNKVLKDE